MTDTEVDGAATTELDLTSKQEEPAARLEEALADLKAGRVVSNKAVCDWISSWGTPHELPRPKIGD